MTLLIGTISNNCAVLTADGLSKVNPTTGGGLASDNFTKIFPVPELPIAFTHHGFNIIDGKMAGEFINQYIVEHNEVIANSDILTIANDLRAYAQTVVSNVLQNSNNKGVIGFWIVGFGKNKQKPELYEICWPDKPTPCQHGPVVCGGDGQKFLKPLPELKQYPYYRVPNFSTIFAVQYHRALYRYAEAEQKREIEQKIMKEVIFGGYSHQLSINNNGWTWEIPPLGLKSPEKSY